MCHRMDLDVWEVIDAAKTKPFGFMPFYPGPGLGGHCIPIDPHLPVVEGAAVQLRGAVHRAGRQRQCGRCPSSWCQLIIDALNSQRKSLNGSRVHVIGVAYKRDVNDLRESPALEVLELLAQARRHRVAIPIRTCPSSSTAIST